MPNNSIRSNISKEDVISEIKLLLSSDIEKKEVVVVVEGKDDIKVLRKLLDEKVNINESFSGSEGVNEIIQEYFKFDNRVIGIRDRDYKSIVDEEKIFLYDYCCLEIMIASYKDIFESVYYEYYNGEIDKELLFEIILNSIKPISLLRKINEKNGYRIKFKGMSISTIIDNYIMDIDKLIEQIKNRNTKFESNFICKLRKELIRENSIDLKKFDLLHITQGHDFIEVFQHYCKNDKGKDPSKDDIASSLRCLFNINHFIDSNLYRELKSYEEANNFNITRKIDR